jgi:hypothetical protein
LRRGIVGKGERGKGNGEEGGGVEYSQPVTRVDGNLRHDTKEGFPSK